MKRTILFCVSSVLGFAIAKAQPIPEQYKTDNHLQVIVMVDAKIFQDSLKNEKCQMLADESFLERINRKDTANYFFTEDGSVIVVKSTNMFSGKETTNIFDAELGLELKLKNMEEKHGMIFQIEDKNSLNKREFSWKKTDKEEFLDGLSTNVYHGKSETYRGEVQATAWITNKPILPDNLKIRMPQVNELDGTTIKLVERSTDQCMQRAMTMQVSNIMKKEAQFEMIDWTFEDFFSQPDDDFQTSSGTISTEEEYHPEYEEEERMEWVPTTWEEELNKFEPVYTNVPDIKAKTEAHAKDSVLYTTPFPINGLGNEKIKIILPENWQIINEYLKTGKSTLWLSNIEAEGIEHQSMFQYRLWKNDQVIIRITKVAPNQQLNNVDGHYDMSGDVWGDDEMLYQSATRYFENEEGRKLKMERCLIKRVSEIEGFNLKDDYLIEGFVHSSENSGFIHQFVVNFITLNEL